jgi:hypothetical protein
MDNLKIFNLAEHKRPEIIEDKRKDWVTWGDENSYFDYLMNRYKNSATNNSIINSIVRLMYGKGLSAKDAQRKPNEYATLMSIFGKKDVKQLCLDLKLFGKCAIQVHYSKDRKQVKKAYHIPVNLLAPEKCNEDGDIEAYYFSDNWNDVRNYEPKRIPSFGYSNEAVEVLYIQPYSAGMKYFAHVDYQGGVDYTLLEEEISDYLINEVQNGFSGTKVINVNNGVPTEEQQGLINARIKQTLTGSKGQKVIVSFNDNKDTAITVDDIPLNDAAEQYSYLSEECMRKIMLSHSVTSPLIFGIATSTGFSSNADELENSFNLFDNMVIKPFQNLLLDAFDSVLEYNGISLDLYFPTLNPFINTASELEGDTAKTLANLNSLSPLVANKVLESMTQEEIRNLIGLKSVSKLSKEFNLEDYLNEIGEDIPEGYIVIDERDVEEVEDEDVLNAYLEELEAELTKKEPTLMSKVWNFVSTGTARPTARSSQDKQVKDRFFKVRYKYTGNKTPERGFCKAMMNAGKLYRKEDIDKMSTMVVNKGLGEFGADTYDIFRFKGGARCHHKWQRVTMMVDLNEDNPEWKEIGTRAAEIKGFKVTNPFEVSVYPNNLPLKGFSPNNKNLPKDVK